MNTPQGRLQGKVAVITGAASGMGHAGAVRFAREGASLVLVDKDAAGVDRVAQEIESEGHRVFAFAGDVSSYDDNEAFASRAWDEFGRLDIVWANAGIPQAFRPIADISPDEFDRQMSVNAKGPWLAAKAALPRFISQGGGTFLITASLSGLKGRADASAYQASKGAAVMLTRSLAREFGQFNVRVNSICPLATDTPMWAQFMENYQDPDEAAASFTKAVPLGRFATVDDIANAALFLASDEASFIHGVNLVVDGGASS